ncbi:RND family efflux transporter, MFP subunit [Rhizobiales bacterium GAS191]|jgi:RND family efflux transporter MFP subunit|nr:RND family efflux transporter, MFP subunit [Rhizobiales bacterium GAS113]SED88448.1 RND family efflux transporter, MFP subunit [Rhizobiales bacterium GAS188]SEE61341.1 RND family efflux transporter, MFP subunit [Rhizobiales bacterium GAS191]
MSEQLASSQPLKTPSRRRLLLIGICAIVAAGAIAADGLMSRARSKRELVQWTNAQAIPTVALAELTRGDAQQSLTLPGNIQPYSKAAIYARVSGYLKSWQQDIGAHVTVGQLLATIDTPDLDQQLAQARADLATAEANEQLAAITAKRYGALVGRQIVAQQVMDEKAADAAAKKTIADSARANLGRLQAMESFKSVVAPFAGVVTLRNTSVGALINAGNTAGQELFEVSDLHRVRIYVQVPQSFSADLRPGLKATFEMPQFPGRKFDATLITTSNAMDPASRSVRVELQADNADGTLVGGDYCRVDFRLPGDPNMVRLPATALIPVNRGVQVATLGPDNKVTLKAVQLGRDFGDSVEVTAGLAPQDRVIDSPPETLQNGDMVQLAVATPASISPQAGAPSLPTKGS